MPVPQFLALRCLVVRFVRATCTEENSDKNKCDVRWFENLAFFESFGTFRYETHERTDRRCLFLNLWQNDTPYDNTYGMHYRYCSYKRHTSIYCSTCTHYPFDHKQVVFEYVGTTDTVEFENIWTFESGHCIIRSLYVRICHINRIIVFRLPSPK